MLSSIPASAPFPKEQLSTLNQVIPKLDRDQIIWLEGFLSGIRNQAHAGSQIPVESKQLELTILFGSESGNAEGLADNMAQATKSAGWEITRAQHGRYRCSASSGYRQLTGACQYLGRGAIHPKMHLSSTTSSWAPMPPSWKVRVFQF